MTKPPCQAQTTKLGEGLLPEIRFMFTDGQLEPRTATVKVQFEVNDITFVENFVVMTNLTRHCKGLMLVQRNSTIIDMRQIFKKISLFAMKLKDEDPKILTEWTNN